MSKLSKFLLICGCGLFCAGLLLTLISWVLGGSPYLAMQRLDDMGVVHLVIPPIYGGETLDLADPSGLQSPLSDGEAAPNLPATSTAQENGQKGDYEIRRLDFSFDVGDVNIITGDDFDLIYGNQNSRRYFYEKRSGDTWIIGSNKQKWSWFTPGIYRDNGIKLTVVLPRDFVADSMVISLGAGSMTADRLCAGDMLLDVGLGECRINSLSASAASLKVSVGDLRIQQFMADTAKAEVSLGNMELNLTQPLDQYRSHLEVGLGNVNLGGYNYSGVANYVEQGAPDAPYSLDVNCGLGSVKVRSPF